VQQSDDEENRRERCAGVHQSLRLFWSVTSQERVTRRHKNHAAANQERLYYHTGVGITIGVGAAIIWLPAGTPLLTRRATRVTALPYDNASYEWLSDHEFVTFTPHSPQPLPFQDRIRSAD
jgi:hypothetical protein